MDKYLVNTTKYAEGQLKEISHYIANELNDHDCAMRILDLLENEIYSLSQLPQRIVLVDEEPWHSEGIHKMIIKNFIVYFWIDEARMTVQITGVVYAKRDQVKQLAKMNMK